MNTLALRLRHFFGDQGPKLLRDLMSLVFGQFANMVLGFVAFSYLARTLSTDLYGTLEFTIALAAFSAIVIECGVGMIAVREMAKAGAEPSRIASAVVAARALIAVVVAPLVASGAFVFDLPAEGRVLLMLYALSLFFVPLKQDWLLQSREHMRLAAAAHPLRGAVFAAVVIAAVASDGDLIWIGVAELLSVAVMTAYYVGFQYRLGVPFRWRAAAGRTLYYVREGLAIGLSNVLWAFMIYAPMFLLVTLTGDAAENAWLGASQRLMIALVTASFLYHFNIYPTVAKTVLHDRDRWQRIIRSSVHVVAWGGIGIAVVFAVLADQVMALIFGARFAEAGPVLAVLIWAFPLRFLSGHARWSLVAAGEQKWLLGAEILGSLALVATALSAIPEMGATGAALALLAGIAASGVVTQVQAERLLGRFDLARQVLPAVAAGVAAYAGAIWLTEAPLLRVAVAVGVMACAAALRIRPLARDLTRVFYAKSEGDGPA